MRLQTHPIQIALELQVVSNGWMADVVTMIKLAAYRGQRVGRSS